MMKKSMVTSILLGLSLTVSLFAQASSFQSTETASAMPASIVTENTETMGEGQAKASVTEKEALRYDETEAYREAYRKTKENCKFVFPKNPLYSKGIDYLGNEVELVIQTPEAQRFFNDVSQNKLKSIEELKHDPVVLMLDRMLEENMNALGGLTSDIDTPERDALRAAIAGEFLRSGSARKTETGKYVYDGKVRKEYKAAVVFGLPASGKSSFVDSFSQKEGMFVFDKDMIKEMIPEYAATGGAVAGAVHLESNMISDDVFREFLSGSRKGDNIVIQTTGDHAGSLMHRYVEPLEAAGYDVEIKYVNADLKLCLNRVVMRAIKTGRIIYSKAMIGYGTKPAETYEWLKTQKSPSGKPYIRETKADEKR